MNQEPDQEVPKAAISPAAALQPWDLFDSIAEIDESQWDILQDPHNQLAGSLGHSGQNHDKDWTHLKPHQ